MYHFLQPESDSTIYEGEPARNVGADEILELGAVPVGEARALLRFDLEGTSVPVLSGLEVGAELRLSAVKAAALPASYDVAAYPVERPWERGTGRRFNDPAVREGVTWEQRADGAPWDFSGADFTLERRIAQSFDLGPADVRLQVGDLVSAWARGEIDNNGLIVILEDAPKGGLLRLFGGLTHTVYGPLLVISYDDSVYDPTPTQQRVPVLDPRREAVQVQAAGVSPELRADGVKQIRAVARPAYQRRRPFVEDALPALRRFEEGALRYSLTDVMTGRRLISFSDASRLSFDESGYYLNIDLSNVQPERQYALAFRYADPTGYTETYEGTEFRVIRG